jgi:hypothetical protein
MNLKTNVLIASRERINSSEVSLWQNYHLVMLKRFLAGMLRTLYFVAIFNKHVAAPLLPLHV